MVGASRGRRKEMQAQPGGLHILSTQRAKEHPWTTETSGSLHIPPNPTPGSILPPPGKKKAAARFCLENIYFTTVVSDNLAIFI